MTNGPAGGRGEARVTAIDADEQEALAQGIGYELTETFLQYVRGEVSFADVTLKTYETLQDLEIVASGDYEVEYEDGDDYNQAEATEEQEELSQEPAREAE